LDITPRSASFGVADPQSEDDHDNSNQNGPWVKDRLNGSVVGVIPAAVQDCAGSVRKNKHTGNK